MSNPYQQDQDESVKIVILGAPGVGKTSIVQVSPKGIQVEDMVLWYVMDVMDGYGWFWHVMNGYV
jgi:hypothetical protein